MFWKALWEINIAAGPSSSFPYPPKIPVATERADKLQNKNRCGRKNDLWTPPVCSCFYVMPGFGALFFFFWSVVHLELFQPIPASKCEQEERWEQQPELKS